MMASIAKTAALTFSCTVLLTGCDFLGEVGKKAFELSGLEQKPFTLVIPPGYRVNINGVAAPIFGFAKCPPAGETMIGDTGYDDEPVCIVIKPTDDSVDVLAATPGGPVREHWAVEREGGKTRLRRPDGELVVPAS